MKHSKQLVLSGLAACGLVFGVVSDASAGPRATYGPPNVGQGCDRFEYDEKHGHYHRRFDKAYRYGYQHGGRTYRRVGIFGWTLWLVDRPVERTLVGDCPYGGPEMVSEVKAQLNFRGYAAGPVNGYETEQARKAIANFQSRNGLEPSGLIDEPLLKALRLLDVDDDLDDDLDD